MSKDAYRKALQEAIHEYEQLAKERAGLDDRIAHLVQTIGTLSRLCNFVPTVQFGLTEACRMALKSAGHALTAVEIRRQLEAMGMDLSRYQNPLAAIHTVLKRLCRSGEASFAARAYERPAYAWKRTHRIVSIADRSELPDLTASFFGEKHTKKEE